MPEPGFKLLKKRNQQTIQWWKNHSVLEILLSSSVHPSQTAFWDPVITRGRCLSIYKDNTTALLCHGTARFRQCFPQIWDPMIRVLIWNWDSKMMDKCKFIHQIKPAPHGVLVPDQLGDALWSFQAAVGRIQKSKSSWSKGHQYSAMHPGSPWHFHSELLGQS